MNDFLTRLIPGFIYVSLLIGSLLYSQFLFVLLMFLFCLIIIFEYGKVLRNDNVHLKSIKEKNKLTEINKKILFFYTEFTPLLFLISLFILGIIVTFHSLEDKIVKFFLKNYSEIKNESRYLPSKNKKKILFNLINKKPIVPTEKEIKLNPSSRSAKLRYGIKVNNSSDFSDLISKFKYLMDIEDLAKKL